MPGIFYTPISRKRFLGGSAALLGSLLAGQRHTLGAEEPQTAHLALLSDTHLPADSTNEYRGFRPVENLRKVVPDLVAAKPQAAILNGDAARLTGEYEDYLALKGLLQPLAEQAPIHIGMGNHDDRKNFFRVFKQKQNEPALVNGKHVSVFELGGTRFVVLDSLLYVNQVAGLLGQAQRKWLTDFLVQADDRPIVFFFHHTLGDGDGDLLDFERVYRIMKPYRQVKAIFYGHSHAYSVAQRDHIYLINQPATGYNFSDAQPVGWLDAKFTPQGVGLTLHAIGGNLEENGQTKQIEWAT